MTSMVLLMEFQSAGTVQLVPEVRNPWHSPPPIADPKSQVVAFARGTPINNSPTKSERTNVSAIGMRRRQTEERMLPSGPMRNCLLFREGAEFALVYSSTPD